MTFILRAVSRWIPLLLLVGCSSLTLPETPADFAFESTKTKSLGGLTVTVAVPGPEECKKVFGLPLFDKGIQPVWVRIENRDDVPYIFQPTSIDVDYFAALEVAYRFYSRFDGDRNRRLDDFFERMAVGRSVEPQHELSGFVFTNVDLGGKHVYAKLVAPGRVREFSFYLHVPGGLLADHEKVHFDALFADEAIREVGLAELRRELEAFPCCTTNKEGRRSGDPLNLVLVGTIEELKAVFTRQRWDETELIYSGSLRKTVGSFLLGTRYRYSPVSPLYVFGRSQDFAMQKIRDNVNARNHLRLWMTPLRFEGKPVWIGQVSRDIGVRFTTKTWNLTTHKIAADVDETRNRLVEDLMIAGRMERLGFVQGVGTAPRNAGRPNLTGDLYFTDGLRAVMVFSDEPVPVLNIELFDWEWPPKKKETRPLEPVAGQSAQEVVQH